MPEIKVSREVLRKLRALRQSGEVSDEQVLERILTDASTQKEKRLRAYEKAEQDIQSTN